MKFKYLNTQLHFFLILVLMNLLVFSAFRLVFYFWFYVPSDQITASILYQAFYLGLKYDLQLSILINLPLLLLAWLPPLKISFKSLARYFWLIYLLLINAAIINIYILDFGHYDYLSKRIDVTIIRFLEDFAVSLDMVWESYPVIAILTGFIFALFCLFWVFNKAYFYVNCVKREKNSKKVNSIIYITTIIMLFLGVFGKFSTYPLRWSDAFFSTNSFVSALASNPIMYFANTLKNKNSGYDFKKSQAAYPIMAKYLDLPKAKDEFVVLNKKSFTREEKSFTPLTLNQANPNIVMVFLESFGYDKTGLSGNPLNPTPNFDALARQGILFDQFYTPQGGTARSVFTAITGIPDIEMVRTSTRNPLIVSQHTVINSFSDYKKFYFIGGSVSWGNIRGLLGNNIPNIKFYEEQDYESVRNDVWGIQDHDLFKEANDVLKQTKAPFFAIIQTSGNHRPYTIPDDNHGFKVQDKQLAEVEPYGFRSVADYNSFRYLDQSIGYYIDLLKKEDYSQNTLFFFFGDHGNERQVKHRRPAEEQLLLTDYHVPFLIYSPGLIKQPKVIHKVASEVDVLPTIASVAGINYINTSFGRDLFNPKFDHQRYAFTYQRNGVVGLIGDKYYFKMKTDGSQGALYDLDSLQPTSNIINKSVDFAAQMKQLAQAYYESIRYVRHNNSSNSEE